MPKLWADNLDEHRSLVRARLVAAYVDLLAERPVEEVTVAAVAARAGVARSAVYNYVEHLHDLALLHTEQVVGEVMADLQEQDGGATAAERLEQLVRTSVQTFAADALGGMDLSSHLDEQRTGRLLGLLAPLMAHLADVIAGGVASGEFVDEDPQELTTFVWAAIGGHRALLGSGRVDARRAGDTIVRLLGRALAPPGDRA